MEGNLIVVASAARSPKGSMLLEQVVSIGLVAILLLVVAFTIVRTQRSSQAGKVRFEANMLAQNTLEAEQAQGISARNLGHLPLLQGRFSNDLIYQVDRELFTVLGQPATTGLTDQEIKGIRVTVTWRDLSGAQKAQAEGIAVKVAR